MFYLPSETAAMGRDGILSAHVAFYSSMLVPVISLRLHPLLFHIRIQEPRVIRAITNHSSCYSRRFALLRLPYHPRAETLRETRV